MINIESEKLVPVGAAGSLIPWHQPPSRATIWRWILSGVRGRKLESVRIGGRRFTSEQAIARFLGIGSDPIELPEMTKARRTSQDQAAINVLERRGL